MVLEVLELKEELVVPALARVALPLEQPVSLLIGSCPCWWTVQVLYLSTLLTYTCFLTPCKAHSPAPPLSQQPICLIES